MPAERRAQIHCRFCSNRSMLCSLLYQNGSANVRCLSRQPAPHTLPKDGIRQPAAKKPAAAAKPLLQGGRRQTARAVSAERFHLADRPNQVRWRDGNGERVGVIQVNGRRLHARHPRLSALQFAQLTPQHSQAVLYLDLIDLPA